LASVILFKLAGNRPPTCKDENIVPHGYKYYPVRRPRSANNRCFGSLDIFIKVTTLPGIEIMKNTSLDYQWVKLEKLFHDLLSPLINWHLLFYLNWLGIGHPHSKCRLISW
jgi:hypothetical protein